MMHKAGASEQQPIDKYVTLNIFTKILRGRAEASSDQGCQQIDVKEC
jgi:hypothetical protein